MRIKNYSFIKHLLLSGFLILAVSGPVFAQTFSDAVVLSLDEALEMGKEKSFGVRLAEKEKAINKSRFQQSSAVFLPQIIVEETGVKTNDPLNVFGFKLKQEIVTTTDFTPALLNDPDAKQNYTTKFEIRQPLINPDGILQRSAASYQYKSSVKQYEGMQHSISFQIKNAYYQVVLAREGIGVLEASLKASKEFELQALNYFNQDLINRAEYLDAKVHAMDVEQQLIEAENNLQQAKDQLRYLLNIDQGTDIETSTPLEQVALTGEYGEMKWNGNSTMKAIGYQVKAAEQMVKASKFSFLPRLNLFGSYAFNDGSLLGTDADSYMIGASFSWNLFSGMKQVGQVNQSKAELQKAKIMYEQAEVNNEMQIKAARRNVTQAQKKKELAELTIEQAEEDLRIKNSRYNQGLEKTGDLLMAEAKLSQFKIQKLQALYQYNIGIAMLEFLYETEL